jgi:hypothetical protein
VSAERKEKSDGVTNNRRTRKEKIFREFYKELKTNEWTYSEKDDRRLCIRWVGWGEYANVV